MRFLIHRTSEFRETKPIDKAFPIEDEWGIDINTLNELLEFIEVDLKGCDIIIHPIGAYSLEYPEIEIYDDYRE